MAALRNLSHGIDVGLLESCCFPCASPQHFRGKLSLQFGSGGLIVLTLCHLVGLLRDNVDQLALLEEVNLLLIVGFNLGSCKEFAQLILVFILQLLGNPDD